MTDAAIRAAGAADVAAVEAVVRSAYSVYLLKMETPPGPMLDDYDARIAAGQVHVAVADGEIAGALVLIEHEGYLLLDNVAVSPDSQGGGVGRDLVGFAEAEAKRRGYAEIRLYTHVVMTENIAFYGWLGYDETHRVREAGYDRVYMRKLL